MIRTIDSLALLGLGAVIHASLVGGGAIDCAPGVSAFLSEGAEKALLLSDVAGNLIAYALLAAALLACRYARMRARISARLGSRPITTLTLPLGILLACSALSLGIEGSSGRPPVRTPSAIAFTSSFGLAVAPTTSLTGLTRRSARPMRGT